MKTYARHDDALARSLIEQMLTEIGLAWGDFETETGVLLKRDDIRALVRAAQGHLDDTPQPIRAGVELAPEWVVERAEEIPCDRRWSWHEWMLVAAAWYYEALATDFVRARPMLRTALSELARLHTDKMDARGGSDAIERVMRRRRPFAGAAVAMVGGR